MNFCSQCGGAVTKEIPPGDNRERFVCKACALVHYQNPRIVAGCLVTVGERVLLAKRAIEPRRGYWTLPAGFLENGEGLADGAVRETFEEVCAEVRTNALYTVFSLPHISQIYCFFRAELEGAHFSAGEETLAAELFAEPDIPWEALAFPVIRDTLRYYFDDRRSGTFPTRHRLIERALRR